MWEFRKGEKYESFKNVSTIYKRRGWNGNRRGDSDHRGNIGSTRYSVFYEENYSITERRSDTISVLLVPSNKLAR